MSGYTATSATALSVVVGPVDLQTQSALSFLAGQTVNLSYATNPTIYMQGTVLLYNAITGQMAVNVTTISGVFGLQPVFNTQPWGETSGIFSPWNISLIGTVPAPVSPTAATIQVRILNSNWDGLRGQGLQNFVADIDAVAQIIAQRLKLWQGEWFENTSLGVPVFQNLLGHSTTLQAVALILRTQILGTPYVTGISAFTCGYVGASRSFTFSAIVSTQFSSDQVILVQPGQVTVSG